MATDRAGPGWRVQLALADEAATKRLGARIATAIGAGDIVALSGGLGAGKTTLARAIIQHLAGTLIEVPSPTFTLVQHYPDLPVPIAHYDLYRVETPGELAEIGFGEIDADAALLVEWPERAGNLLPSQALTVDLAIDGSGRRAALSGERRWRKRFASLAEPI